MGFMGLVILYALKAVKQTAIAFPFFIALSVFVRKALPWYFSAKELEVLDADEDLPPDPEPKINDVEKANVPLDEIEEPEQKMKYEEVCIESCVCKFCGY